MTVVAVRGVRKRFGAVQALDGLDLVLRRGEVHALLGPNGAGKSTLLSLVLGLTAPDEGTVEVLGEPARPGRAGVAGFVGAPGFYPYLSGRRNLQLLRALDAEKDGPGVDEVLERVGLRGRADTKVGGWSTGMLQRLGVAAALLRAPVVLVLDEPTSGLDPQGCQDVHALLGELAEGGTAVLLASHDLGAVATRCPTVTVVARGRVRFTGTTDDLRLMAPAPAHLVHTSDDGDAERLLSAAYDVQRRSLGLRVAAATTDPFVLELARRGVAVRRLVEESDPLQRAFEGLTA